MRNEIGNQNGIATTEFIIVSFVFVLILAAFLILGNTILSKMKSLIQVRNLSLDQMERFNFSMTNFKRETVMEGQAATFPVDACLSPYLASKPSRVKAEVRIEIPSLLNDLFHISNISDKYVVTEDTWQNIHPVILGTLVTTCPG